MTAIDGLGERGKALWESLGHESPATADGAMALEAARLVDRLEELDSIIQGKGVLELMQFRVLDAHMGDEDEKRLHVEVKFNNVLAEARQQQNVLRQMLVTLAPSADAKTASTPTTARPPSVTDEFTKRRRERGA